MGTIKSFEEIIAWKKAHDLAVLVYRSTERVQFSKDFGSKDQVRRSAVSISSNIAEGFERDGNKEFIQFLSYSKGSAGELKAQLYIAKDLNYIEEKEFIELITRINEATKMIGSFMNYLKKTKIKGRKFQVKSEL